MKTTYILNCAALVFAAFLGSVFFPNLIPSLHAETASHQKRYLVRVNLGQSDIERELNKQSSLGWKFEQCVNEGSSGDDLIFSRQE